MGAEERWVRTTVGVAGGWADRCLWVAGQVGSRSGGKGAWCICRRSTAGARERRSQGLNLCGAWTKVQLA